MFLTPAQLHTLTGYEKQAHQAKWLRSRGIRCEVNAANQVVVSVRAVEAHFGAPVDTLEPVVDTGAMDEVA